MADSPADIANQALDALGAEVEIGDLEEGTKHARVILRAYLECLKQMLRAANWEFAQTRAPLELLADASGQTADVGSIVPGAWLFEYAYPEDCVKARLVRATDVASPAPAGNYALPAVPLTAVANIQVRAGAVRQPLARFAIGTDSNYPPRTQVGQQDPNRKVILCNVNPADLVYVKLMLQPSSWDPLFRGAFVSYLAQEIAMGVLADKKMARQLRADQIGLTKQKISEARVVDGNEVARSTDMSVDWMRARASGTRRWGGASSGADSGYDEALWQNELGGGGGAFGSAFDPLSFADGTSF